MLHILAIAGLLVLKVKGGDIALNGKTISKLRSVTRRMGPHTT